jgi:hypothetical protein
LPVHVRYAIDKKPTYYKTFSGKVYSTDEAYLKREYLKTYTEIKARVSEQILNFSLKYTNLPPGLTPPKR